MMMVDDVAVLLTLPQLLIILDSENPINPYSVVQTGANT